VPQPVFYQPLKKQSDIDVLKGKGHYCGRETEATGRLEKQKVTHASNKQSDPTTRKTKNHPCLKLEKVKIQTNALKLYRCIQLFQNPNIHIFIFWGFFTIFSCRMAFQAV